MPKTHHSSLITHYVLSSFIILLTCLAVSPMVPAQGGAFTLQIGSTQDEAVAKSHVARLRGSGHSAYFVRVDIPDKGTWYRLRVGRFASSADAQRYARGFGFSGAFATGYDGPAMTPLSKLPPPPKPKPTEIKPPPANPTEKPVEKPVVKPPEKPPADESKKTPSEPVKPPVEAVKPPPVVPGLPKLAKPTFPKFAKPPDSAWTKPIQLAGLAVPQPPAAKPNPQPKSIPKSLPVGLGAKVPIDIRFPGTPPAELKGWVRFHPPINQDLTHVFFADERHGWATGTGGSLIATTDGGETWIEQITGLRGQVSDIFFADAQHGWVLLGGTRGLQPRDFREEQALFQTEDGGKSWKYVAEMDALCLFFVSPTVGYAGGTYGALLRTEDGGRTWKRCASPEKVLGKPVKLPDAVFAFVSLHFRDAEQGWAVGNFYGDGLSRPGGLFFTADGGKSWEKRNVPFSESQGELLDARFFDASTASVSAELYQGDARYVSVFSTTDGGKTWTRRETPVSGYHVTRFASPPVGWTAGTSPFREDRSPFEIGVWSTCDGGATWIEETTLAGGKIHDLFVLNSGAAWAVGEGGLILRKR